MLYQPLRSCEYGKIWQSTLWRARIPCSNPKDEQIFHAHNRNRQWTCYASAMVTSRGKALTIQSKLRSLCKLFKFEMYNLGFNGELGKIWKKCWRMDDNVLHIILPVRRVAWTFRKYFNPEIVFLENEGVIVKMNERID